MTTISLLHVLGSLDVLINNAGIEINGTVDQQPYLQGFYTIMVLFVYKISGGLLRLSDINTGLKFVTKASVDPYLSTQSRFEASSNEENEAGKWHHSIPYDYSSVELEMIAPSKKGSDGLSPLSYK